jgi:hypothetical protein
VWRRSGTASQPTGRHILFYSQEKSTPNHGFRRSFGTKEGRKEGKGTIVIGKRLAASLGGGGGGELVVEASSVLDNAMPWHDDSKDDDSSSECKSHHIQYIEANALLSLVIGWAGVQSILRATKRRPKLVQ